MYNFSWGMIFVLFDERYEEIITLLNEIDYDFALDYSEFERNLPFVIIRKCKKMKTFEYQKGDFLYILDGVYDEEVELIVEKCGNIVSALNIYRIKKDKLSNMEIKYSEGVPSSLDDKSVSELCVFETVKKNGDKVGYSFVINRRKDGYYIIENQIINNKRNNLKKVVKVNESKLISKSSLRR